MSSRTKWVIGSAITVVVLVAVIFVGWNLSSSNKPPAPTVTATLSPAQQSQDLYQQGQTALTTDQTSTAAALFKKALTLDPNNNAAKRALDSMTPTKRPSPPVSNPTTAQPKPKAKTKATDPFLKKVADIGKLLPKTFSGYSLGARQKLGADASVTGNATAASAAASNIAWAVHDRKSATGAKSFVTKTSKKLYAKNAAAITVGGHTGYFGTDGTHFASTAVARGRYVFEVTLTSVSGSPSALKALALQAAGAFPAAP